MLDRVLYPLVETAGELVRPLANWSLNRLVDCTEWAARWFR